MMKQIEDIIKQVDKLTKKYNVLDNYFSSFTPLENTPLENREACNPKRTGRLYQTEYLLNKYNFKKEDIIFDDDGFLNLKNDPKYVIAQENMDKYPIDINNAKFKDLIKIPGIGLKSARRIIHMQKTNNKITSLKQLQKIGANINRCKTFIKINNTYQSTLI